MENLGKLRGDLQARKGKLSNELLQVAATQQIYDSREHVMFSNGRESVVWCDRCIHLQVVLIKLHKGCASVFVESRRKRPLH
jgi:hypothetical protein